MKKTFTILAVLASFISFAQLQNANWCFGNHAEVNFTLASPTPTTSSCALNTNFPAGYSGNSSSVSDANGKLLFYTF